MGRRLPLIYTDATLDPSSGNMHRAADPLWGAVWQWAAASVPKKLSQEVRRRPNYREYRDEERFRGWRYWICPGCGGMRGRCSIRCRDTRFRSFWRRIWRRKRADAMPEPAGCFACLFCHRVKYFTRLGADAWELFHRARDGRAGDGRKIARPPWMTEGAGG